MRGTSEKSTPAPEDGGETKKPYKPWPEDVIYKPGVDGAPSLKAHAKYGEAPEVGDLPRIGKRSGDPRCSCKSGFTPCQYCVFENVSRNHIENIMMMPGVTAEEASRKCPFTGMPFDLPHPFEGPTPAMNTGRGCDVHGNPYKPPPRFTYLNIHRFNEGVDDYEIKKSYEVDFGPDVGSEEFQDGLKKWKASDDFIEFERLKKQEIKNWEWKDPTVEKPWEHCQKVEPNPWLSDDYVVKNPMEQHVTTIREWAAKPHLPWDGQPQLEGVAAAALEDELPDALRA